MSDREAGPDQAEGEVSPANLRGFNDWDTATTYRDRERDRDREVAIVETLQVLSVPKIVSRQIVRCL